MAAYQSHGIYAYSASKAGVIALTRCLAAGLAKHNIRVNCVAPGLMDTPLVAPIMNEKRIRRVQETVPLKRHGRAEETANTVLFLASPESDGLSGKLISLLWDNWKEIPQHLDKVMSSDIYAMRRIIPKDRGYDW